MFLSIWHSCDKENVPLDSEKSTILDDSFQQKRLKEKILIAKEYIQNKNYNQDIVMLIDYKIPSGKYRFFVYSFKADKVIDRGLVAHGSGSVNKADNTLVFSNTENSYQSSLGKFKIGNSYRGQFGKSYRLVGLDKSNSNALRRAIVLHSYHSIPNQEIDGDISLSLGCPMVSHLFFNRLEKLVVHFK
ncbi:murein L,D-transpeptidase catalytic domain family protein [Riemerella anatipestifer]|uniref:murein L,D-transpeptidase catalytic domain-containing protein n=1 Tax=Riemerella anatipestifer TaxID=34085 RepID=UPI001625EFCD|nr:murein L,D-transpeptidase catalytic domain family protein [Riemerella anatipestifer]WPC10383.1 murein L,D-transpeptidase catalytic domain family protein [Riemerella anatipestifer]WPC13979.1 murein L,D-transpeptidase catalytic domain family protein [Riemerella anatipestifer]WPC16344.1 murein L,D-transpeptidase catalytic domain family protein [Riemerella anatipestifer]